jgi:hypothetical protein
VAVYLVGQFISGFRLERSPSCQNFVQNDAQAENIATAINSMTFASGLFWTHVSRCSGVTWPFADVLFPQCQPKVGHKGFAGPVKQDVTGLDVPMDQPLLVGIVQRLGHRR